MSMHANKENETLVLRLDLFESRLLLRVLNSLIKDYQLNPHAIEPEVAAVWYSTRGCKTAKMSQQDTREFLDNLYNFKSATLEKLRQWSAQLARGGPSHLGGPGSTPAIKDDQERQPQREGRVPPAREGRVLPRPHIELRIKTDDAADLLTALNDYRLALAARHAIGQAEMDLKKPDEIGTLPPDQQTALFEIHFLAWIIEEILGLLPGNYTNWQETL